MLQRAAMCQQHSPARQSKALHCIAVLRSAAPIFHAGIADARLPFCLFCRLSAWPTAVAFLAAASDSS